MRKKRKRGILGHLGRLFSVLMFAIIFAALVSGVNGMSKSTTSEGMDITKQAIQRAAIVCYASEGFYPPNLAYIEDNYNLTLDHNRYLIRYEVFASNVMPEITVLSYKDQGKGGFQ